MFLLNVGYRWTLASSVEEVNGLVYLPCGNNSERLTRAALPECQRRLFDPQLYLAGLKAANCTKVCARLATYPWFGVEVPVFDSSATKRSEWEAAIRSTIGTIWPGQAPDDAEEAARQAVEYQVSISCTHIILPSPLISEREDEAFTQAQWLDYGLEAAAELDVGQPVLATIAIDEQAINDNAFAAGGFLETIVDQITSRENVDGVYILIAQTRAGHPFATDGKVLRTYLRLSRIFGQAGYGPVLVNYADVFSQVCMGAGATGFAGGQSHSLRRLSLAAFTDDGGGVPLPKYYSQRTAGEYLTENDLNALVRKRLLRRIRDVTQYSQPLLEVLQRGGTAAQVPAWAESQNNLTEAGRHFVARLSLEAARINRVGPAIRVSEVRDWLEEAAANAMYLESRIDDDEDVELQHAPTDQWLQLLDDETT